MNIFLGFKHYSDSIVSNMVGFTTAEVQYGRSELRL